MNKILSLFTLCVMLISIMASVSPSIKNHLKSVSGNYNHAGSLIPIPEIKEQNRKLAKQSSNDDSYNTIKKNDLEIMGIKFID